MAEAKADEIRFISDALADIAEKHQLPVIYNSGEVELWQKPEDKTLRLEAIPLSERMQSRLEFQSRKEQSNVESITSIAAIELASAEDVAGDSPDDDWVTRFFSYAQDISSEQMQVLWGRILAGEVKQPGSFSLRTLDFVRNMTKSDAELFEHVAKCAVKSPAGAFVAAHDKNWLETNRSLRQGQHFALAELDIMYPSDLGLNLFRKDSIDETYFLLGDRILLLKRGGIASEITLTVWKFTSIGAELLALVDPHVDDEYLEHIASYFLSKNGNAFIARVTKKHADGRIQYQIIRELSKESPNKTEPT